MRTTAAVLLGLAACARHPDPSSAPSTPSAPAVASAPAAASPSAIEDAMPRLAPHARTIPDRATDLEARSRKARGIFGPHTAPHVVGDTFVIAGKPETLAVATTRLVERALPLLFDSRFAKHPDEAVTILLFPSTAEYARYVTAEYERGAGDLGLYDPVSREIAANLAGGAAYVPTVTHELVHALFEADFPSGPLWIDEGIASLYEAPVFTKDGIHGEARNWRHAGLLQALASPRERGDIRLDSLFGMPSPTFAGWVDGKHDDHLRARHYALARSVCAWLDAQGKLWPFYHAWRDGFTSCQLR